MRYELIGDPPSQDFFQVNQESGTVSIRKSLMEGTAPYYVLRVAAYDSAKPERRTVTTVTIPVRRNVNAPKFVQEENYEATINENADVGKSVLKVSAEDRDQVGKKKSKQCLK